MSFDVGCKVPDAVQNVTVYKSGRQLVGLRWKEPARVYGELDRFLITYWSSDGKVEMETALSLCVVWPHWYCHTLTGLMPDTTYNITVSCEQVGNKH